MANKQSSYQKAKNSVTHKGSTVGDLKFELRKQFKSRLRDMRSKSFDACRDLATLKLEVNEGYNELVSTLNSQLNKFDFVQPDDVFKTLKEIQQEILEQLANEEVSDYEAYIQDEMDAIVENLITCRVCGLYSERDICEACSTKHFAD